MWSKFDVEPATVITLELSLPAAIHLIAAPVPSVATSIAVVSCETLITEETVAFSEAYLANAKTGDGLPVIAAPPVSRGKGLV